MTQEEKELLLKDLCGRLPYMPMIKITYQQQGIKGTDVGNVSCDFIEKIVNDLRNGVITDMQIFLRPMSSITEEEKEELSHYDNCIQRTDFFYTRHIDCRLMIEKGLAIEAPEGMYKLKEK